MKALLFAVLVVYSLLATGAPAGTDEPDAGRAPKIITVDAATQARFGILIATLKGATAPNGVTTSARVLDPGSLLRSDSELAGAAASFAASRAEALRTRKLFSEDRTVSARAVEAASAQEQADLQRVNAARRQLAIEWGGGVADLTARRRADLLNDLARARAELVRVEIPTGLPIPRAGSSIVVRGNSESAVFAGVVLGTLPTADARLQTRGVLVELKGDAARLPIGQMLSAEVPAEDTATGVAGVVLPRSALLRRNSRVWAYVQTSPATFVRREVRDYHPMPAGWFVASGFAPGDRVVAAGAAALLGVENPAPAETDTDPD